MTADASIVKTHLAMDEYREQSCINCSAASFSVLIGLIFSRLSIEPVSWREARTVIPERLCTR